MPIFYNQGAMQTELILAGNGPGELAGWIRPTAEAAKAAARTNGQPVRLTLALLPTQFAGGTELDTARSWNLFDRILPPGDCLRLAAGVGSLEVSPHAVLVHLGGDPWLSGRLADRLRIPACAFSETPLIATRHRRFGRILVPTDAHAAALQARGVPAAKISVTGDPRAARPALARRLALNPSVSSGSGRAQNPSAASDPAQTDVPETAASHPPEVLMLLPGSRDRLFSAAMALFGEIAAAVRAIRPGIDAAVIVSPFVSQTALVAARQDAERRWPTLPLRWITGDPWPELARATFAVSVPGTTTLELAAAGIPFAAVVHLDYIGVAAVEGPLEWIARATGLHRLIKRMVLDRYLRRAGYLALPNQRAGREIVPEWIGRWTAEEVANRLNTLLDAPDALAAMSAALAQLYERDVGAPSAIVAAAMEAAGAA